MITTEAFCNCVAFDIYKSFQAPLEITPGRLVLCTVGNPIVRRSFVWVQLVAQENCVKQG